MKLVRLSDFTARERAAIVTLEIVAYGREMTTAEIAQRVEVTWHGARDLMNAVSRVVPVRCDNGYWHRIEEHM